MLDKEMRSESTSFFSSAARFCQENIRSNQVAMEIAEMRLLNIVNNGVITQNLLFYVKKYQMMQQE